MTNEELLAKIKAEIERRKIPFVKDVQNGCYPAYLCALMDMEDFLSDLEKECEDFPTTDEEMAKFLATHPKVEVPDKYKTPDWMFEKSEKPMNQDGLEKEIDCYFPDSFEGFDYNKAVNLARHFAEWGYLRAAEKYDEIEYNRQRAEASGCSEIPKDAKDAAEQFYQQDSFDTQAARELGIACFVDGAKWQADHAPLPEDTVLFNKGVAEGRRLESEENKDRDIVFWRGIQYAREMMMKDAVEAEISAKFPIVGRSLISVIGMLEGFKYGDKVRVIIIKKEDK